MHNKEDWYTLLMIPYGRAGAGFSLIDVTKLDQPLHLYYILNDTVSEKVHRIDHNGKVYSGSYSTSRINETSFKEHQTATYSSSITFLSPGPLGILNTLGEAHVSPKYL